MMSDVCVGNVVLQVIDEPAVVAVHCRQCAANERPFIATTKKRIDFNVNHHIIKMIINKNNNNNNNKKVDLLMRHVAMRVLQQRDGDEEKIHNQVRHKVPAKHSGKRSEINPCCQD